MTNILNMLRTLSPTEQSELVTRALSQLNEGARALLLLREIENHSYAELSSMTGLSISALKGRLSRARKQTEALLMVRFQPSPGVIELTERVQNLVSTIPLDRAELLKFTPRQFEEFIAELWKRFGYDVELTARTKDGGRDVIAVRKQEATLRFLIECKRYAPDQKIGVALVRALYGVKVHENATKAILATTSSFTGGAETFFDAHQWELEAKDYAGILEWIKRARRFSKDSSSGLWVPT